MLEPSARPVKGAPRLVHLPGLSISLVDRPQMNSPYRRYHPIDETVRDSGIAGREGQLLELDIVL